MDFTFSLSAVPEVLLTKFDPVRFPKFAALFDPDAFEGRLKMFTLRPDWASWSLVLENSSDRDITALRYQWKFTSADGQMRTSRTSSDSYFVAYQPILKAHDRMLISYKASYAESVLDHVLSGGGCIGGGISGGGRDPSEDALAVNFEIDMLLFADGEIAGKDEGKFAAELVYRKQ